MDLTKDVTISIDNNYLDLINSVPEKVNKDDLGALAMKDTITPSDTGTIPPEGSYWCHSGEWKVPDIIEPDIKIVASYIGKLNSGETKVISFGDFKLNIQANSGNDLFTVSLYHPGNFQTSAWQAWDRTALTTYNFYGSNTTWSYANNIGYGSEGASYFHAAIWDVDNDITYQADIHTFKYQKRINAKIRKT